MELEYTVHALAPAMEPVQKPPRVPKPADETEVLREQLDYLIGHTCSGGSSLCSECRRYLEVRIALLSLFQ